MQYGARYFLCIWIQLNPFEGFSNKPLSFHIWKALSFCIGSNWLVNLVVSRVRDVHLSNVLDTPYVLSTEQGIKSAYLRVRNRIHFEICFVGTSRSNLIPLLLIRGVISCRKHSFPPRSYSSWKAIIFPSRGNPSRVSYHSCFPRRFSLRWPRRGDLCLSYHLWGWCMSRASCNHVASPFLSEEANLVPFTGICICVPMLTRPCSLRELIFFLEVLVSCLPLRYRFHP